MKRRSFLGLSALFAAPTAAIAASPTGRELPAMGKTASGDWCDLMIQHHGDLQPMALKSSRYVEVELNGKRGYVMVFDHVR